jgi:hypothetical protein
VDDRDLGEKSFEQLLKEMSNLSGDGLDEKGKALLTTVNQQMRPRLQEIYDKICHAAEQFADFDGRSAIQKFWEQQKMIPKEKMMTEVQTENAKTQMEWSESPQQQQHFSFHKSLSEEKLAELIALVLKAAEITYGKFKLLCAITINMADEIRNKFISS